VSASQHMVQANGLRFRTIVDGPTSGELVILLHGFPEGAESWTRQVGILAKAGALAVAPDMRGYGMTDAPGEVGDYAVQKLVDDVAAIIAAFGRTEAHIAGHDWGSLVAWFFAGAHPEMTKSLTVLSVGHPAAVAEAGWKDADQRKRSGYIGLFMVQGKAEQVLSRDEYGGLRDFYALPPNPQAVPRSVVENFVRSLSRPGRLTAALNYYRANFSDPPAWAAQAARLKVTAPTVLLWGDQDPALGRLQAETTERHMTGDYRLDVLERAGHWLQFERPDEVGRSLVEVVTK
jgi:pimeloyl-ACP methyl ester carboxylesterase